MSPRDAIGETCSERRRSASSTPSLQPGEQAISTQTKTKKQKRTINTRSTEARDVGKKLACLALAWSKQDGHLRVRQREQLRRALSAAAEVLGWALIDANPVQIAAQDVAKLTKTGGRVISRELDDALLGKKSEMSELKKTAESIQKLAEASDFADPIEVHYSHTAREAQGLVTRVETVTLTDAKEAQDAAATIEKKMASWEKLREQMVEELKQKRRQLDGLGDVLASFVESSKGVMRDVFATLY